MRLAIVMVVVLVISLSVMFVLDPTVMEVWWSLLDDFVFYAVWTASPFIYLASVSSNRVVPTATVSKVQPECPTLASSSPVSADPKAHDRDTTARPPSWAGALARRAARLSTLLRTALLLVGVLGATAASALEPGVPAGESAGAKEAETGAVWRRLVPETRDFSILVPGNPSLLVKRNQTIVGQVTESKYLVEMERGHVSVETHVLPKIAMLLAPARTVLDRTKEQILKTHSAEQISYTDLPDQPYRTARLVYRPGGTGQAVEEVRMILSKNRLYLLTAALPSSEAAPQIAARFFDSFRIGRTYPSDDASPAPEAARDQ
jgi:hypothetical protein